MSITLNEEINAVFRMKSLQMTPKMTKNRTFSDFRNSYSVFVSCSIDFVDYNVEVVQQGKKLLSGRLLASDEYSF